MTLAKRQEAPDGTTLGIVAGMAEQELTVEASLGMLSDAVGKASDDLQSARQALDRMRADLASRNTSVSRTVIAKAELVVDHLRETDRALRDVVTALEERD